MAGLLVEVGAGGSSQTLLPLLKPLEADGAGVPLFCSISLRELKTILPLVNFKVSSAKFLKDKFLVSFMAQPGNFLNLGLCLPPLEATARLQALLRGVLRKALCLQTHPS